MAETNLYKSVLLKLSKIGFKTQQANLSKYDFTKTIFSKP